MAKALLENIQGIEYYNRDYRILKNMVENKIIANDWLVTKVEYTLTCEDWDKLAVVENYTYTFDDNGDFATREKMIDWYDADWNVVNSKPMLKVYNNIDKYIAGEQRRKNVIELAKMTVVWLIAQTEWISIDEAQILGTPFIISVTTQIEMYKGGAKQPLIDAVTNATEERFDNDTGQGTIKQIVLSIFNY